MLNPKPSSGSSSGTDSASRRHAGPRGASSDILRNELWVRVRGEDGQGGHSEKVAHVASSHLKPSWNANDVAVAENVVPGVCRARRSGRDARNGS